MTEEEEILTGALVLFKEHTHLELKTFKVFEEENMSEGESKILDKALEFCSKYITGKLHLKNK